MLHYAYQHYRDGSKKARLARRKSTLRWRLGKCRRGERESCYVCRSGAHARKRQMPVEP
jgi:hypothetical protein